MRIAERNTSATYALCAIGLNMMYTKPPYNGRRCKRYPCVPGGSQDGSGGSGSGSGSEGLLRGHEGSADDEVINGVANLTIRNLSSEQGAVNCVADLRGLNESSTLRDIHLEDISLRALIFGFGCNDYVRGVRTTNVHVRAPQQSEPCGLVASSKRLPSLPMLGSAVTAGGAWRESTLSSSSALQCANRTDCTPELQHLLDASLHGHVVIPSGTYPTRRLLVRSHTKLDLRNATLVVIAGGMPRDDDCLLNVLDAVNVTIEGGGDSTMRMVPPDRSAGSDEGFSHMHVLNVMNSTGVTVQGVALEDAPGDGIYIGSISGKRQRPASLLGSSFVTISRVVARRSGRNGMSIIACVHCLIEDSRFELTNGSEPMAGVDLEPNTPRDCLHNITFRRCTSIGNGGGGFEIYAGKWMYKPVPLPIVVVFEQCLVDSQDTCRRVPDSPGCGGFLFDLLPPGVTGSVVVRDSTVRRTVQPPIMLGGVAAAGALVSFERVTLYAPTAASPGVPSAIQIQPGLLYPVGHVHMTGLTLVDPLLREAVRVFGYNSTIGVADVDIQLSIVGAGCAESRFNVTTGARIACTVTDTLRALCYDHHGGCTKELQAALDSTAGRVVISPPADGRPLELTEPGLWPRSNTLMELRDGVVLLAKRGAFVWDPVACNMMTIKDVFNVSIVGAAGPDATIRMRKADYNSQPIYKPPSADRMGISLRNCSHIRIDHLIIEETGGDGIYIGRNHEPLPNCTGDEQSTRCHGVARDVHISNVRSLRNSRQGMSLVAGQDIIVEDSEFSWTQGACPQAGIDLEPSSGGEPVHNITFRRLVMRNNTGGGMQLPVDPFPFAPGGLPLLITVEDVHIIGANWSAKNDGCTSAGIGFILGPMRSVGLITFNRCSASELPSVGFLVQSKAMSSIDRKGQYGKKGGSVTAAKLSVTNLTLHNTALRPIVQFSTVESPIVLAAITRNQYNWTMGNISLDGVTVVNSLPRPWLSAGVLGPYSVQAPVAHISGSARVLTPSKDGCAVDSSSPVDVETDCSVLGEGSSPPSGWHPLFAPLAIASIGHAPSPSQGPSIEIKTSLFRISIDPATCLTKTTFLPSGETSEAVPFALLYNRVEDAHAVDFEACSSAVRVGDSALQLNARHGYGSLQIAYEERSTHVIFVIREMSHWRADPEQKHVRFGHFWQGILHNTTAPLVMGRLQGALGLRGLSGPQSEEAPSAGFLTISPGTLFDTVYFAKVGARLGFTFTPTERRVDVVEEVRKAEGLPDKSPRRFLSWYWTPPDTFNETSRARISARIRKLGAQLAFITSTTSKKQPWTADPLKFPSGLQSTVELLKADGLEVGLHLLPVVVYPDSPDVPALLQAGALLPEIGLAPTYRSGQPAGSDATIDRPLTEDLGFWWLHQREGALGLNGNPRPCGQDECLPGDWPRNDWAPNLKLYGTQWSAVGKFRNGGSLAFSPGTESHALLDSWPDLQTAKAITLGLVLHRFGNVSRLQQIVHCPRRFSLELQSNDRLRWTVWTARGHVLVASGRTALAPSKAHVLKLTYADGSAPKIFLGGRLDGTLEGSERRPPNGYGPLASSNASVSFGARVVNSSGPSSGSSEHPPVSVTLAGSRATELAHVLHGSLEELYLKNVSTEARPAYRFSDGVRPEGTYLLDLSRPEGQHQFASRVAALLNSAPGVTFGATQWDGFAKQLLIAGESFPHSNRTYGPDAGSVARSETPDLFRFPTFWGLGYLRGLREAYLLLRSPQPAIECSFLAPGLGPWRPDMAPYADERGDNFTQLGLVWHPLMLARMEASGTLINAYNTRIDLFRSLKDVDYWFGGLVACGIPPQIMDFNGTENGTPFDDRIGSWMRMYRRFGHASESGVRTLWRDPHCWRNQRGPFAASSICHDVMYSALEGGELQGGLYLGSGVRAVLPNAAVRGANASFALFQASGVAHASIDIGDPAPCASRDSLCRLMLVAVSAISLNLSGPFFVLRSKKQSTRMSILARNGTVLARMAVRNASTVRLTLRLGERAVLSKGLRASGRSILRVSNTLPPRFAALTWEDSNGCGAACADVLIEAHRLETFDANATAQAMNVWKKMRGMPLGRRYMRYYGLDQAVTTDPNDDILHHLNTTYCKNAGYPNFTGPWLEHGAKHLAASARSFFAAFAAVGGQVDELALDTERWVNLWTMTAGVSRPPRECVSERFIALESDPRFAGVLVELQAEGFAFEPLSPERSAGWLERAVAGYSMGNSLNVAIFNDVMNRVVAKYYDSFSKQPLLSAFPAAIVHNYEWTVWRADACVPDPYGHLQCAAGRGALNGNAASTNLYNTFYSIGTPYAPGVQQSLRASGRLRKGALYPLTAFNAMRLDVMIGRSAILGCKDHEDAPPFKPWIAHRGWGDPSTPMAGGVTNGSDLWQETVHHVGLAGAAGFNFFNPHRGFPHNPANASLNRLMADTLKELGWAWAAAGGGTAQSKGRRMGSAVAHARGPAFDWITETSEEFDFASEYVLTGGRASGAGVAPRGQLWRFTPLPQLHRTPRDFARLVGSDVELWLPLANGSSQLQIFPNASLPSPPSTSPAGLWILQAPMAAEPFNAPARRVRGGVARAREPDGGGAPRIDREVVGFHVMSSGDAWRYYDWKKLTALIVFGASSAVVAPDAALSAKAAAEQVALLGEMGWACLPTTPCSWLANVTLRTQRAVAAVDAVRQFGLAGLNVDVEMYHGNAADFTAFVRTIRMHASKSSIPFRLSVDISVFAATHPGASYHLPDLAALADHLILMAYDMSYWNPGVPKVAVPGAPLNQVRGILKGLLDPSFAQHVPAEKLVLGVPWYGYLYPCNTSSPYLSPCRAKGPFPGKQLSYAEAAKLKANATAIQWDNVSSTPRFDIVDANNEREAVLYEDVRSTAAKYAAAAEMGLRGVAIWTPNVDYLKAFDPSHQQLQAAMWAAVPSASSSMLPSTSASSDGRRTCSFKSGRPAGAASSSVQLTCSPAAAVGDGQIAVVANDRLAGRDGYLDAQVFSYPLAEGVAHPQRSPHVHVALLALGADGGCACAGCVPSKPGEGWERALSYLHDAGGRGVNLALLPENFRGMPGLPPQCASAAEPVDGPTVAALSKIAAKYRMNIVAPIAEEAGNGGRFTTAVVIDRDGKVSGEPYRKAFPVLGNTSGHGGETGIVPSSRGIQVYDLDFGRLAVLICFDINFHELWHQAAALGADVIAWPSTMVTPDPTARAYAALHKLHILATGFPGEVIGPAGEPLPLQIPTAMPLMKLATLDTDQAYVHYDFNGAKVARLLAAHPEIVDVRHHHPPFYLLRSLRPETSRVRPLLANYSIETAAQYIARSRKGVNLLRSAGREVPA